MDLETLFNLYLEISGHVDTINRELGMVVARLDWVEWWIKIVVVPLTSLNTLGHVVSLLLQRRNNRKNTKK